MRKKLSLLLIVVSMFFIVAACGNKGTENNAANDNNVVDDILQIDWEEIEERASGTEVNMFMWGGDEGVNAYIDQIVAPMLKEKYDIDLIRTSMDADQFLQKLMTEKEAGQEEGTMDILWINGENFKNAKENGLLFGSFSSKLPNVQQYVDLSQYEYDFGTPVEEMEAPWGKVQFVFFYDEEKVPNPPKSFDELLQWVKDNPGKFTYPEAKDFTGSAFLRHVLYEKIDEEILFSEFDEAKMNEVSGEVWEFLNEMEPYLWREGETYPQTLEQLDQLYSQGEVWMTMGYNEARAQSLIDNGVFPESTKSFVLDVGSIGNTHYLSIPFNSPNVAGALVAINEFLSPEAQLEKLKPELWGENSVLDITKLPESIREEMEAVERGDSVLSAEELQASFITELDAPYVEWAEEKWFSEVVEK